MVDSQIVSPTKNPAQVRLPSGEVVAVPVGWACLEPGDVGLTRRVKSLGPSWTVIELRGRKKFSHGVWAPAENIESARQQLDKERSTEGYARRRASAGRRRQEAQQEYTEDFRAAVLAFISFTPSFEALAGRMADAVTAHATPVGSGTVARTQRIPLAERARAAVIAWMRHQTTVYDHLAIARIRGERRRVRSRLAEESRQVLTFHQQEGKHPASSCPLCRALPEPELEQKERA